VRLLADTNIVALAVDVLRSEGHDVDYVGERAEDPGYLAILQEAHDGSRVLLTKDHDIGALVFKDAVAHAGILLIDDLGSPQAETTLLRTALSTWNQQLSAGAFVRAGVAGAKVVTKDDHE